MNDPEPVRGEVVRRADRPLQRFDADGWPVGRPVVVEVHHHHYPAPAAEPDRSPARGDPWAPVRRWAPAAFSVLAFLALLSVLLLMVVPPFMALMATLMSSLVTVAACAVALALAVVAFTAVVGRVLHTGRRDRTMEKLAADQAPRP